MPTAGCLRCAGRTFSETELQVVTEVVANGGSLSWAQLMVRVCRRLAWRRVSGALKVRECRDLLLSIPEQISPTSGEFSTGTESC